MLEWLLERAAKEPTLFGFAQSIFDLMQRYLPAQLFNGLVRPVMAARFSVNRRFEEVATICNLNLNVNLVLIGLAATVVAAGGAEMLLWVSRDKYGERAVALLLLMCLLVALESWRHVLDQLSHTVERYGSEDVDRDYPLLRALLMGSVVAVLLPGAPMPVARLRAELFHRYGLAWESGMPPDGGPPDGTP